MSRLPAPENTAHLTVAGACDASVLLYAGDVVRIINTTGTRVVDTWAFACDGKDDLLSMEHCREVLQKNTFDTGDVLITNRYRPILRSRKIRQMVVTTR